jgi:CelD/BcsL family acetyltransferase involved in cellulose biosynthesis
VTVRLRVCHSLAEIGPAERWNALRARAPASITASRPWLSAAAATTDRHARPHLLTVQDDERLLGLLALTVKQHDDGAHVQFAGCPNNDLSDLLAEPGHEAIVGDLIVAELARIVARGWSISLTSVDPDGLLYRTASRTGLLSWTSDDCAPIVDLRGPWREAASRARRAQWDRRMRALSKAGPVELRRLEGDPLRDQLATFLRLRAARRAVKGHQDLPPTAFLTHAVNELAPDGRCILMELRVNGDPVASDLYLIEQSVALMWLRGLDPSWQRFSCGHLLLRASAEAFERKGFDTLDLGRGDEPYKAYFGAQKRVLLHGSAGAMAHRTD